MYRPVSSGKVFPSITANGRERERRLLCIEYCTPQEKVLKEMEDDVCNLQLESEGFILVEFCSGAHATVFMHVYNSWNASIVVVLCRWTTYLKAEMDDRTEVKVQDLKFFVKGNP